MSLFTQKELQSLVEEPVDLERPKLFPSRRSVYVLGGKIVVAYNAERPYPAQVTKKLNNFSLHRLHLPTYASNDTPYLCAAPALPDYSGPILGRLAQTNTQFPIVKRGLGFALDPTLCKAWKDIEEVLDSICRVLTLSGQSYAPLDYRFPPSPSSYGYMGTFPTRQSAVAAVQRSRNAFQAVIAHVSWSALVHRHRRAPDTIKKEAQKRKDINEDTDPCSFEIDIFDDGWKEVLMDYGVHPAWIQELNRCTLCNFSITRAGIILDNPQDWVYNHLLPTLILSNFPVWLIWGDQTAPTNSVTWSKHMKVTYGPNRLERLHARIWMANADRGNVRVEKHDRSLDDVGPRPSSQVTPQPTEQANKSPPPVPEIPSNCRIGVSCEDEPFVDNSLQLISVDSCQNEPPVCDDGPRPSSQASPQPTEQANKSPPPVPEISSNCRIGVSCEDEPFVDNNLQLTSVDSCQNEPPVCDDDDSPLNSVIKVTQSTARPLVLVASSSILEPHSAPSDLSRCPDPSSRTPFDWNLHEPHNRSTPPHCQPTCPNSDANSVSNAGLDIHQWLQERRRIIDNAKTKASIKQLNTYSQRETAASKHNCPGRQGAHVYEWSRDEQNRPMRVYVPRSNVEETWCMYGNKQRWYNCVRDEWELCAELDPSDTPDHDTASTLSSYDSDDSGAKDAQTAGCLTGWTAAPTSLEICDINARLNASWDPPIIISNFEPDVLDVLTGRFGFSYQRRQFFVLLSKKQWSVSKSMRLLGDRKGFSAFVLPDGLEVPAIQYLMHLSALGHPDCMPTDMPGILHDLYPYNEWYLASVHSSVTIKVAESQGMPVYILTHKKSETDDSKHWVLGVTDPCVALLAVRSRTVSLRDFAIHLMQSRTPFYTLRRADHHRVSKPVMPNMCRVGRRLGLGQRPIGHSPDLTDYIAYTAERSRLLLNQRIARAAVKRGGILSRVVAGLVEEHDVLDGPSNTVDECYFSATLLVEGKEVVFIDDEITDEEGSVLVGLYRIKPDVRSSPAEQSWWPTLPKFMDSGLNIGLWTPKCEDWYESRLNRVLDGKESTYPASVWRSHLKLDTDTKRVYKGARELASRFIQASKGNAFEASHQI